MKAVLTRGLEMALVAGLLLLLAPLILLIALAIVIDSGWPVFFRSPRLGRDGKPFDLFYFRTMMPGVAAAEQRLTRVGRLLRDVSLDHVPQLFNVLRGDMRIVGPRPRTPDEADLDDENYRRVLAVKPGMISPAILRLGRTYNATDFATRAALEKEHLDGRSAWRDLRLTGQSVRALLRSRGNIKKRGEPRDK